MLSRYGVFACSLVLLLALPACDSTDAGGADDMLTQQEADALLQVIATGFRDAISESSLGGLEEEDPIDIPDPAVMPESGDFSLPIDSTATCSGGGTKSIVGKAIPDLEAAEDVFALQYDVSQFSTDCVTTADNTTFHLDIYHGLRQQGQISLGIMESETALTVVFSHSSSATGTVVWEIGDRRGVCEVNLSTDEDITIALLEVTESDSPIVVNGGTSGRICDIPVQHTPEEGELVNLEDDLESATGGLAPAKR